MSRSLSIGEIDKHIPAYVPDTTKCIILVVSSNFLKGYDKIFKLNLKSTNVPFFTAARVIADGKQNGMSQQKFSAIPADCSTNVAGHDARNNVVVYTATPASVFCIFILGNYFYLESI